MSRHRLFKRLSSAARVTQISAPAGSGKTFLVRSWLSESGLMDSAAWVSVPGGEHDPQQFWMSVLEALKSTIIGAKLLRPLSGIPDLDGWSVVERLLEDLSALEDPLWLVIDDAHELRSAQVLAQLELLVMRAPTDLRVLLITRKDVRLGLHRLPLSEFPLLRGLAHVLASYDGAAELERGLDILLTCGSRKPCTGRSSGCCRLAVRHPGRQ